MRAMGACGVGRAQAPHPIQSCPGMCAFLSPACPEHLVIA